jgi:hypothetical protein
MAADGGPMLCDQRIVDLQWSTQGHTFFSTVGILPLKCFDMIVGADWLEEHSPMWVHWGRKLMRFTREGKRVSLQGLTNDVMQCPAVKSQILKALKGLLNRQAVSHCIQLRLDSAQTSQFQEEFVVAIISDQMIHPKVEELLEQFSDIFQSPNTLPPPRPFDHTIPLLLGSQPVNIRAYRYSPAQKDEIEK